jgi:hypothetical protein
MNHFSGKKFRHQQKNEFFFTLPGSSNGSVINPILIKYCNMCVFICDAKQILCILVQSNHYKYMVLIKVIAIDLFSMVKCEKSCSD